MKTRILSAIGAIAQPQELSFDPDERRLFSADIFHRGTPPAAILRPAGIERLASLVGAASRAGLALVPRGGGISYSAGHVSARADVLMVDLRGMADIGPVHDGSVTVAAGCSWASLNAHLADLGLRTPFWGPASGLHATVGGTLSQQGALFGSGIYGPAGDHVRAMRIVTAGGDILDSHTDSADPPSAFVGDCGVLGIKAEITLPVISRPHGRSFAACAFADEAGAAAALERIAGERIASECFLFDRGWAGRRSPGRWTGAAVEPFPGHVHAAHAPLEIHAAFEAGEQPEAEAARARFLAICRASGGMNAEDGVMPNFHARPFLPPALMFGPDGRRWVPLHFIVPHAEHAAMIAAIRKGVLQQEALIRQHRISWGWSAMLLGRDHVLIEPSLYWADAQPEQVTSYFAPDFLARQPQHAPDPAARAAVHLLRTALIATGRDLGARHMQVGRLYPPDRAFTRWTLPDLKLRKARLDPHGLMNPGAFGL